MTLQTPSQQGRRQVGREEHGLAQGSLTQQGREKGKRLLHSLTRGEPVGAKGLKVLTI